MSYRIPFNRPTRTENDLRYIQQALEAGFLSGDGPFTKRCHAILEAAHGAPKVLLTTSCTHALEMAAFLLQIEPGDEVIVPSFTFVSTVNAFVIRGATPVFADIHSDTLGLDERQLEKLITPRTRAIVVVHYAGIGCQMDAIGAIASAHGIPVVEDNAHGLFGSFQNRLLGTFGAMSSLSFHETKNFTCGEGGALVINDSALVERAEIVREKGTDRSRFHRGEVDKYGWVDLGSSYLPSEILAAMLCAQLESRDLIQSRRQQLWDRYASELADWSAAADAALPVVPADRHHSAHMFHVMLPSVDARNVLMAHLKSKGMLAVSHYIPLNASSMGLKMGGRVGQCPVAEHAAVHLLRLPFYTQMTDEEQTDVIRAVQECPRA